MISKKFALDLETACAVEGCRDSQCKHGLIPHLARITIIGLWSPDEAKIFRTPAELKAYLSEREFELVGANLKFDLKMLHFHGYSIPSDKWVGDSQLAAHVCLDKVPQEYLSWYAVERNRRNALLSDGHKHRAGTALTLKVLAPYFLKVEPFWENPEDHDDPTYVLRDCEYSYRLCDFFDQKLEQQGLSEFYRSKQLGWARCLLDAECEGIAVDTAGLQQAEDHSIGEANRLRAELNEVWGDAFHTFQRKQEIALESAYKKKFEAALAKKPDAKLHLATKYAALANAAKAKIQPINLDSPAQLTWLLRDYYGQDIRDFDDEESTGKAVINRLIASGRKDLEVFRDYRMHAKRLSAFFPSYREMLRDGRLHTSFNPTGTRTGRISSSGPNLQQVPPGLRTLFIAPPGYNLAVFDESAIEPRLIAYYTECKTLFDILATGADFHGYCTSIFFGLSCPLEEIKKKYPNERKMSKEVDLAAFYGAGAPRLFQTAAKYGITWTLNECKQKLYDFRREFREVFEFKAELDEFVRNNPVRNFFGRKHWFADPQDIYMKNFNTLIQGTASDLVQDAATEINKEFQKVNIDGRVLLLVHDEAVVRVPENDGRAVEIVQHKMTDYLLPTSHGVVKLEVEGKVSKCWAK